MNCACTLLETNKNIKAYTVVSHFFTLINDEYTSVLDNTTIEPVHTVKHYVPITWDPTYIGIIPIYDVHGNYWKLYEYVGNE